MGTRLPEMKRYTTRHAVADRVREDRQSRDLSKADVLSGDSKKGHRHLLLQLFDRKSFACKSGRELVF